MYLLAGKSSLNLGSHPDLESGCGLPIQIGFTSPSAPVILFEILSADLLSCPDLPPSDCSASYGVYRQCM